MPLSTGPSGAGENPRELPSVGDEVLVGNHYKTRGLEGEAWRMLGEFKYKMGIEESTQILLACVPERFGGADALVQRVIDGGFGKIERAEDYVKIKRAVRDEFGGAYIGCDSRQEFFAMQDQAKGELEQQAAVLESTLARIRRRIDGNR